MTSDFSALFGRRVRARRADGFQGDAEVVGWRHGDDGALELLAALPDGTLLFMHYMRDVLLVPRERPGRPLEPTRNLISGD